MSIFFTIPLQDLIQEIDNSNSYCRIYKFLYNNLISYIFSYFIYNYFINNFERETNEDTARMKKKWERERIKEQKLKR